MAFAAPISSRLGLSFGFRSLFSIPTLAAVPAAISLNLPATLAGIWESILKAVPKKKTSYSKKRHRQLAGKALKDLTSLNRCSGCGQLKRAHLLCRHCMAKIKDMWVSDLKAQSKRPEA